MKYLSVLAVEFIVQHVLLNIVVKFEFQKACTVLKI